MAHAKGAFRTKDAFRVYLDDSGVLEQASFALPPGPCAGALWWRALLHCCALRPRHFLFLLRNTRCALADHSYGHRHAQ